MGDWRPLYVDHTTGIKHRLATTDRIEAGSGVVASSTLALVLSAGGQGVNVASGEDLKIVSGALKTGSIKAVDGTSSMTIANSTGKVTFAGDVQVNGAETVVGNTVFQGNTTFGDASTDIVDFVARVGTGTNPDLIFQKQIDHTIKVDASTSTDTPGGALLIAAGAAVGNAAGGALTLIGGAGAGVGGAGGLILRGGAGGGGGGGAGVVYIGDSNTLGVAIGSTSMTGDIILGQSTASNNIYIGNAAIANGNTQIIKIGGGAPAGTGNVVVHIADGSSGSNVVTMGNTYGATTLTFKCGAGGISLGGYDGGYNVDIATTPPSSGNINVNVGTGNGSYDVTIGGNNDSNWVHLCGANGRLGFFGGTVRRRINSTSGNVTAGGTYGTTEKNMLNDVYKALYYLNGYGMLG